MELEFKKWINEALYSKDLSNLEGDPYIDSKWSDVKGPNGQLLQLKLTYRWKGYKVLPHQQSYSKPDEFGSLELLQDDDRPGYFFVVGVTVEEPFQREGYATKLYKKALELIRAKGFKGITSERTGRYPSADKLWSSFKDKESKGQYDFLSDL